MNNIVKLSDDGRALCGGCGATLECDKVSGDMPITCPICGGGLEYSAFKVNKDFEEFTLLIRNGNSDRGDYYHAFDSIEELVEALNYRLTSKEVLSGALLQLTTFNPRNAKEGYVEKHWLNMSTCAYQRTD